MSLDLERTSEVTGTPLPIGVEADRHGYELIDGVWKEKSMGNEAATVQTNLATLVGIFLRSHPLGRQYGSEAGYRFDPNDRLRVRKPDLSFVSSGRFPNDRPPRGFADIAPDFAVEVVSPNDMAEEVDIKLDEYLTAGVRLVWVVYVPTRSVVAFKPDGTAVRRTAADTLDGGDVLPGFAVPVAELFDGV